ncbi:MAG TPA: hypothetical protein VGC06_13495 [Actinomycetes bacterium]
MSDDTAESSEQPSQYEMYGTLVGLAADAWGLKAATARLQASSDLRASRLLFFMTQAPPFLGGVDAALVLLQRAATRLSAHEAAVILLQRAAADGELSLEALLSGNHSIVSDSARDLMEIEWLLRDFTLDTGRMPVWLAAEEPQRLKEFGPGKIRRRLAQAQHGDPLLVLPDDQEYRVHSRELHPTPYNSQTGGKELFRQAEPTALLMEAFEIVIHLYRCLEASYDLELALGTAEQAVGQEELIETLQSTLRFLQESLKGVLDSDVLPPRVPIPRDNQDQG